MTKHRRDLLDDIQTHGNRFIQIPIGWRGPRGIGKLLKMMAFGRKVASGGWIQDGDRPDVIIGSSPSLHAAQAASKLAHQFNVPFILEVRDIWPLSLVEIAGLSPNNPVLKHLYSVERSVVNKASRIISLLPSANRYFAKYGIPKENIDWIPNGVDMKLFSTTQINENDGIVVMYAGSHGKPNGLKTIIDAAIIVQESNVNIAFRFVGDGDEQNELQKYADKKGASSITFEPAVPRENIPSVLAQADVLVANIPNYNLYKYGVSLNKLYEYLASGNPIALASSAIGDPVTQANAGPIVHADDAHALAERIIYLASMSNKERKELGAKGKKFVEQTCTFDLLAKQVLACIQKAVQT